MPRTNAEDDVYGYAITVSVCVPRVTYPHAHISVQQCSYSVGITLSRQQARVFLGPKEADEQKVDTYVFYFVAYQTNLILMP